MNDICIFCNSVAETYEHYNSITLPYSCKSCSDSLNVTVGWRTNQYIGFHSYDNFIARYYVLTQKLELKDGTLLTVPPDKVITKMKTVLLLS